MGFEKLRPLMQQGRDAAPVRISTRRQNQKLLVCVWIRDDILAQLGWRPGDYVVVGRGTGKDQGLLLVSRSDLDAFRLVTVSQSRRKDGTTVNKIGFFVAKWPDLAAGKRNAEACHHQILPAAVGGVETSLVITVPDWLEKRPLEYEDEPAAGRD